MTLADDLSTLIPREDVRVCPVCSLLKTLDPDEADVLAEAVSLVSVTKLQDVLRRHDIRIADKRIYHHRNICLKDQE